MSMNPPIEALSIFLRHSADFINDSCREILARACGSIIGTEEMLSFFESRCFSEGFAVQLDGKPNTVRVDFDALYRINKRSSARHDPNFCYVQIGDLIVSIPVTNVPISDMIAYLYSTIRVLVDRQFMLYHMSADGTAGHECVPGQSGSRFVARVFNRENHSQQPSVSGSEKQGAKRRRYSVQHSRVLCLKCATYPPGQTTSRGRQALRECSDVHSYRHVLFRSHSTGRTACRPHASDSYRDKLLSLYFSSASNEEPVQGAGNWLLSRWILPGAHGHGQPIPPTCLFVFHSPSEFDLNKIRLSSGSLSKATPQNGIADSSPQSTPFLRDDRIASTNLMTVIQDLINRRVLREGVTVELPVDQEPAARPVRGMSAQLDSLLGGFGGGVSHRQREELRRLYGPLNGHLVSRAVAVSELSKLLGERELDELLNLAEKQGFKDRPLLVQLRKGLWSRLCPKDVRLAACMLGPTEAPAIQTGQQVPLPEHVRGELALTRLNDEFSAKCLSNTIWSVRVRFEPMNGHPIYLRVGKGIGSPPLDSLTFDDCQNGFKRMTGGLFVTKWSGLIDKTSSLELTVARTATVSDLIKQFQSNVKLRHGLAWTDLDLDASKFTTVSSSSLREELHWCASEYVSVSLTTDGRVILNRAFDAPDLSHANQQTSNKNSPSKKDQVTGPTMLWDVVGRDRWSTDETRNVLSQWASRGDGSEADGACLSPTSRRKRVMAKIALGSAVNRVELDELGVDVHTEYTRWWLDDQIGREDEPVHRLELSKHEPQERLGVVELPSMARAATPLREYEEPVTPRRRIVLSPEVRSPRSPMSPVVKTPVSPISRSRRLSSLLWREEEPRVLRSTKDTRQFEFHPFDPNLLLTGSRSGLISLIDAEKDMAIMQTRVDTSPILGLSWLRAHMNVALYGASSSGLVGVLKLGRSEIDYQPIGRFQNLSSVSINCTDDYFIVSGFSRDVSLFDLISGRKVSEFREIHSNFINITRFANFSPHLLATSSFDSTCKLWDLRKPSTSGAVATYTTPSLNVMCCFSPLDDDLLVSGLDANVVQLSIKRGLAPNIPTEVLNASIPARNSSSNYRRAVYTADGTHFITSGTDENFMRVVDSASGASKGVCRFDGLLEAFEEQLKLNSINGGYKPLKQEIASEGAANRSDPAKTTEYVQSLRGHPIFTKEVGVLLYPFDRSRSSYVCTTQIPN